ncbi:hypothetical protein MXMO3_00138 [Maritalea myrionectae]|uniref:Uncharacterized protein n=1 Tax=Maritalea myrionectae TaxID=454601 RepID=A0A2R4M9Z7_9HYPH|nr:hypothetical protein MXMO3_00138 [Maritalea myrionectae]
MLLNLVIRPAELLSAFARSFQILVVSLIVAPLRRAFDLSSYIFTASRINSGRAYPPFGVLA